MPMAQIAKPSGPILEREIGKYKWLGEYGLKARY